MPQPITISPNTWPRVCLLASKAWMVVAVGVNIMAVVSWILILVQNITVFRDTMGGYLGNDSSKYPPNDPNNGYVNNTNVPKHLGGAIFAAVFDVAMIVFCWIALAADLAYRFKAFEQMLRMWWTSGLLPPTDGFGLIFIIANACLKVFIGSALGAQSYVGIHTGSADIDTPLYCLYSALILMLSSIPTAAAHMIYYSERVKEQAAAGKAGTV